MWGRLSSLRRTVQSACRGEQIVAPCRHILKSWSDISSPASRTPDSAMKFKAICPAGSPSTPPNSSPTPNPSTSSPDPSITQSPPSRLRTSYSNWSGCAANSPSRLQFRANGRSGSRSTPPSPGSISSVALLPKSPSRAGGTESIGTVSIGPPSTAFSLRTGSASSTRRTNDRSPGDRGAFLDSALRIEEITGRLAVWAGRTHNRSPPRKSVKARPPPYASAKNCGTYAPFLPLTPGSITMIGSS